MTGYSLTKIVYPDGQPNRKVKHVSPVPPIKYPHYHSAAVINYCVAQSVIDQRRGAVDNASNRQLISLSTLHTSHDVSYSITRRSESSGLKRIAVEEVVDEVNREKTNRRRLRQERGEIHGLRLAFCPVSRPVPSVPPGIEREVPYPSC